MVTTTTTQKKTRSKASDTKKPKWSVMTYKQIEARRVELGYSKSAIAELLSITNSTYHNWRRGTTVPHANQQETIKTVLANLPSIKEAGKPTTKPVKPAKRDASVNGRSKASGTVSKRSGAVSGGSKTMNKTYSNTHPLYPTFPNSVPDVGIITAAFITSQHKAPSAGSVLEFVRGLKSALTE